MASKDKAEETKTIIRSLLTSTPELCTLNQLNRDYREMVGCNIPHRDLGCSSLEEYLLSIPDTCRVYGSGWGARVEAIISTKSAHINELVMKQKTKMGPNKKKRSRTHNAVNSWSWNPQTPTRNSTRWTSVSDVNNPRDSTPRTSVNSANSPQDSTPQTSSQDSKPQTSHPQDDVTVNGRSDHSETKVVKTKSASTTSESKRVSKVPRRIQDNLKKLILDFPNGILCTTVIREYTKRFNSNLSYQLFGYCSVIEMFSDLLDLFSYIRINSHDYLIYDKNKPVPEHQHNEVEIELPPSNTIVRKNLEIKLDWDTDSTFIPPDVVPLSQKLDRYFPYDLQINETFNVYVGEIYDLSKFYLVDRRQDLSHMMYELQRHFSERSNRYHLPVGFLAVGLYCVTLYRNEYHRAVIINLLLTEKKCVRVLFVDYGTIGNIGWETIWFLPKKFAKLPCQAIRCRLANVIPPVENSPWKFDAIDRFRSLIGNNPKCKAEVASINYEDEILDVHLAYEVKPGEFRFVNEVLIEEKHALNLSDVLRDRERNIQAQAKGRSDPYVFPKVSYIHLFPNFYEIEWGYPPTPEELTYVKDNNIPLHNYLPYYFEFIHDEPIEHIQEMHEKFTKQNVVYRKEDFQVDNTEKELDYSIFPKRVAKEIKKILSKVKSNNSITSSPNLSSDEVETDDSTTESIIDETVFKSYGCSKKRLSELMNKEEESSRPSTLNPTAPSYTAEIASCSSMLEPLRITPKEPPDDPVQPKNSTNPFLNGDILEESQTYSESNPFFEDIKNEFFSVISNMQQSPEPATKTCTCTCDCKSRGSSQSSEGRRSSPIDFERALVRRPDSANTDRGIRTPPGFPSGSATVYTQMNNLYTYPSYNYIQSNTYFQQYNPHYYGNAMFPPSQLPNVNFPHANTFNLGFPNMYSPGMDPRANANFYNPQNNSNQGFNRYYEH